MATKYVDPEEPLTTTTVSHISKWNKLREAPNTKKQKESWKILTQT